MTQVLAETQGDTFLDRRRLDSLGIGPGRERRQFADSRDELSSDAQELAAAVDQYKLHHRRRFITHEELLGVIRSLGYSR